VFQVQVDFERVCAGVRGVSGTFGLQHIAPSYIFLASLTQPSTPSSLLRSHTRHCTEGSFLVAAHHQTDRSDHSFGTAFPSSFRSLPPGPTQVKSARMNFFSRQKSRIQSPSDTVRLLRENIGRLEAPPQGDSHRKVSLASCWWRQRQSSIRRWRQSGLSSLCPVYDVVIPIPLPRRPTRQGAWMRSVSSPAPVAPEASGTLIPLARDLR
jgi:hypothetical protein